MPSNKQESYCQHTKRAVIWTSLFNEPLQTLSYTFLPIILCKQLNASAFQIALLFTLRPLAAILSLYWSSLIQLHPKQLVRNVIITGILTRLPFFFTPLLENPSMMIAAAAASMMLTRGGIPAWMELLKQNLPEKKRSSIFSLSSALSYAEGITISLGIGALLDHNPGSWKWLFPLASAIGMFSIFFQMKVQQQVPLTSEAPSSFIDALMKPWKESYLLLKNDSTFRFFQICFMLAGCGIMILSAVIPLFFAEYLKMSYTEIAIAIAICKGLGFTLSSPIWSNYLNENGLHKASTWLFFLFALYPLLLLVAIFQPLFVYIACFVYGVAQGGSHLIWHISGTLFSKEGKSLSYSNVGVLLVGIRGAFMPSLGSFMLLSFGLTPVFVLGMLFCLIAGSYSMKREIS
jgi:hypothetical protein